MARWGGGGLRLGLVANILVSEPNWNWLHLHLFLPTLVYSVLYDVQFFYLQKPIPLYFDAIDKFL